MRLWGSGRKREKAFSLPADIFKRHTGLTDCYFLDWGVEQMLTKEQVEEVLNMLEGLYPTASTELVFSTPYELLVSTILSAQCTDARVNVVTKELFKEYNTPEKMITLTQEELERLIHSCGFYHNKAKNILAASKMLVEKYDSQVPDSLEELVNLPGVGRKTANVVGSIAFGIDAIAVDTHVFRVANRIGITNAKDELHTELQLMEQIKKERWSHAHHLILWHGRRICHSRRPECEKCPVAGCCEYNNAEEKICS